MRDILEAYFRIRYDAYQFSGGGHKYILLLARWFGFSPMLTDGTAMRIWYMPGRSVGVSVDLSLRRQCDSEL